MQLRFFEDSLLSRFHPLTLTRPLDQLRIGILTIAEKWEHALEPALITRELRTHLQGVYDDPELDSSHSILWINPRFLPEENLIKQIQNLQKNEALTDSNTVIAVHTAHSFRLNGANLNKDQLPEEIEPFPFDSSDTLDYLWDLFLQNGKEIRKDIKLLGTAQNTQGAVPDNVAITNRENLYIGENCTIEPGVALITDDGPIYLGDNVKIMAGAKIRGPSSIGDDSVIKMNAKIYEDTTVGPVCKVGGEVNNTIFHSYTNKGHDGFTGNSLFGQWVNLGADTNVSNLKNNYSTISMKNWSQRESFDSGQQFIGTIMGDHSKTAINTMLNTGTMCGVSCNIFASGFPLRYIPSFSWVGDSGRRTYRIDKALETMEKMMERRNIPLTDSYSKMMTALFEQSHNK